MDQNEAQVAAVAANVSDDRAPCDRIVREGEHFVGGRALAKNRGIDDGLGQLTELARLLR